MKKHYLANTPLILTDENGVDYRVERGETVALSDEQYADVAVHVSPIDAPEADEQQAEQSSAPSADDAQNAAEKPKRGSKKESAE